MPKTRRVVFVCLAIVAAACGSDPDPTEAQTRVVRVDAAPRTGVRGFDNPTFRGSFLAFFPDRLTARPGDTVRFERIETGEPHSVTMGRTVDAAFDAGSEAAAALPRIVLSAARQIPQNLAQSCYLDEGAPPEDADTACEQLEEVPDFDGTESWFSSGFIPSDEPFELRFGDGLAPGTYRFYCVFHGADMAGSIDVVGAGEAVEPQSELDAAAADQLDALVAPSKQRIEQEIERYDRDQSFPVIAGLALQDGRVLVNEFVPFTSRAETGQTVSWTVTGLHNISFRAPGRAEPPGVERLLSGVVQFNEDIDTPRESPRPPADPPAEPLTITTDPYNGERTHASALLRSPGGAITYEMRFSEPGTYRYQCLVHPGMGGIVTVTL